MSKENKPRPMGRRIGPGLIEKPKNFKKSLEDSGIDHIYVNYEERMGNFLFGCWGKVLGVENGSSTNLP